MKIKNTHITGKMVVKAEKTQFYIIVDNIVNEKTAARAIFCIYEFINTTAAATPPKTPSTKHFVTKMRDKVFQEQVIRYYGSRKTAERNLNAMPTQLQVKNLATSEVKDFAITTRAGIYKLVKFVMDAYPNERPNDAFYSVFAFINDLRVDIHNASRIYNSLNNVFNKDGDYPNAFYLHRNIRFLNAVVDYRNRWALNDDRIYRFGAYYPRSFRNYIRRCVECGELYFDQDDIEDNVGLSRMNSLSHVGVNGLCRDCAMDDGYEVCDCCGTLMNSDYEYEWINDEYPVCHSCLSNNCRFQQCAYCGAWIDIDNSNDYIYVDCDYYCNDDCAVDDGCHYSSRRDDWVRGDADEDVDEIITDYHSHIYIPIGIMKKGQKHPLYIGRETEVDGQSRYDFGYDYYENLMKLFKDTCFFETDGSLDDGFEIISQPMTESAFFKMDWEKAFKNLRNNDWKSHDTSTCGTHFHYSDWYLGYTKSQKVNSAKKVCRFFQLYADEISKIARRDYNGYCEDMNCLPPINSDTEFYDLKRNRYQAVNLQNMFRSEKGTIEIRVCRGTLNTNTMLASADFFLHIVRNAKSIAWNKIGDLKLWFKGIKNPNTIDYIKSRNAFVGAF